MTTIGGGHHRRWLSWFAQPGCGMLRLLGRVRADYNARMEDALCANGVVQPNRVFSVVLVRIDQDGVRVGRIFQHGGEHDAVVTTRSSRPEIILHSAARWLTLPHGGLKPGIFGFLTLGDCHRIAAYASYAIASAVSSFSVLIISSRYETVRAFSRTAASDETRRRADDGLSRGGTVGAAVRDRVHSRAARESRPGGGCWDSPVHLVSLGS